MTEPQKCPTCGGRGYTGTHRTNSGPPIHESCPDCHGTGHASTPPARSGVHPSHDGVHTAGFYELCPRCPAHSEQHSTILNVESARSEVEGLLARADDYLANRNNDDTPQAGRIIESLAAALRSSLAEKDKVQGLLRDSQEVSHLEAVRADKAESEVDDAKRGRDDNQAGWQRAEEQLAGLRSVQPPEVERLREVLRAFVHDHDERFTEETQRQHRTVVAYDELVVCGFGNPCPLCAPARALLDSQRTKP